MEAQACRFACSPFVLVAIGILGLGPGYPIWGGRSWFGFSENNPEINRNLGPWGFWMPGFIQFPTGIYLGQTGFNVFGKAVPRIWRASRSPSPLTSFTGSPFHATEIPRCCHGV
jgi:hypothetical protein